MIYKRLIELRNNVKITRDSAVASERTTLDTEQNAIKIATNATSYGIFVEVNVNQQAKPENVRITSAVGRSYTVETDKAEMPGRYFHPLLATLITGAARLMLAITERLVLDQGLEWAFCDTDSMAIAKPPNIGIEDFYSQVDQVVSWFRDLNPYSFPRTILKVEDVNFSLLDGKKRHPLFCWAVSAKRYALFNLNSSGQPFLRKASASWAWSPSAAIRRQNPAECIPRPIVPPEKLGVDLWRHDLSWKILSAAVTGEPDRVDYGCHPALNGPAVIGTLRPRRSCCDG